MNAKLRSVPMAATSMFDDAIRSINAEVDSVIGQITVLSSQHRVTAAQASIDAAAERVGHFAHRRMAANLAAAANRMRESSQRLAEIATLRSAIDSELAVAPATGALHLFMAICYLVAAASAFVTEQLLTNTLTFLLGFNAEHPAAKAMGIAFAGALLVFEVLFIHLRLADDPARFFGMRVLPNSPAPSTTRRTMRMAAVAVLLLTSVGLGALIVKTIFVMAPTREIAAQLKQEQRSELTVEEAEDVKASVLLFSITVLVAGGFLAAVGRRDVALWSRVRDLRTRRALLLREAAATTQRMNDDEKPALAAELTDAGLPSLWLVSADADEANATLATLGSLPGTTTACASAATAEANYFRANKSGALERARSTQPASASVLERVTHLLGSATQRPHVVRAS